MRTTAVAAATAAANEAVEVALKKSATSPSASEARKGAATLCSVGESAQNSL